ncbi:MAG TPA: MFS transporter [Thermomicrobiales bacterium]|nr:MFS transporter [Thermomicrobiales bacterium]
MSSARHDESGVVPGLPSDAAFSPFSAEPLPPNPIDGERVPPSSLLRHPDFLRCWGAQAVSQLGTHVSALALPLIAATVLAASPFETGLLAALGWLPFLLVGLFAGVWVDRLPRRPLMIAADLGRAAIVAIVPVAWLLDRLTIDVLYAVALLAGTLTVLFDVAYLSYLPTLIDRRQLVDGNGRIEATASAAQIVGPGVGGVLIRLVGGPITLAFDAVSFLVSGALLWRIRTPEPVPAPRAGTSSVWREIGEGLSLVRRSAVLRALVFASATVQVAGYAFLAVYVLFMTRDLGLDAGQVGLVLATGGVGALMGSLIAGPARTRFGQGPTIVGALFLFGLTGLLVPLAVLVPRWALPLVVASEFLQWMAIVAYDVNAVSLRQAIVPDRLAGRVNGTVRFLVWGLRPVGSILGGALGGVIGLAGTLVAGEIGMLVAFAWLLASPVRTLRQAEPIPDPSQTSPPVGRARL